VQLPGTRAARSAWRGRNVSRAGTIRVVVITGLLLFVLFAFPPLLSPYWMEVLTAVTIYTIVAMGLGVLVGRVGMVSLGQIAVLALGGWIAARLDFATSLPFPVVLLVTGLVTGVIGTIVGLPALRLSGLYLALITLMLAGAITVVLAATNFPNGSGGFLGHTDSPFGSATIRRPSIAHSDPGYYRYTIVVGLLMFLLALWHVRSKPGRAWAAIRQSEPAALSAGVHVTLYKLWAFALAAFVTGVAGGLLAGSVGHLYTYQFPTLDSIVLLAVTLMGGVYSLWGAILAGCFMQLLPAVLDIWNLPADLLTILFGIGVLQVLLTAPAGLVEQFPKDAANLGRLLFRLARRGSGAGAVS
jgi:branched-chain amino acid transport system permease protein